MRLFGGLQAIELWGFDRMLALRPPENPDPRLLIVTVTENDIQSQKGQLRQGSLSDKTLNQLLETLQTYQPKIIALDIYRDYPVAPQYSQLKTQLSQNKSLIAVCKRKSSHENRE